MRHEYNLQKPVFTAENIDVLEVSRDKNYKHSYQNGRTKHGFLYLVSGSMRADFDDNTIHINQNELVFIPKNCSYVSTYLVHDTKVKIIQFDISGGCLPAYLSTPQKVEIPDAGDLVDAFFKPGPGGHPFYYLSCLYALLWHIDAYSTSIPTKYKKLRNAMNALSIGYTENEKISYYADLCGISEPNFRKLFHAYTGMTPVEYRNELRLNDARIKLQSGEYNVSEAAEAAGFSNLSFFIRLYKKKFGHTPKKE